MAYFGDGASSEGDAHEALNLAGVRRAPVVFVLKNNGWAISTPVRKQTAAAGFAARAEGYGIAGERVDGNDLFAVHDACVRAVARARAGDGPTLIEAVTYRMGPHNTADDPTRYVDPVELEERRAHDPIARVRRHLVEAGLVDQASEARMVEELRAQFDAVTAEVEAAPKPGPEAMFSEVYAAPPPRVTDQRDAATALDTGATPDTAGSDRSGAATPDSRPDRG
jgi:pyruvate dehydrogenase E1 component alpha subunit